MTFGPGATGCRDDLASKIRQGRRPCAGVEGADRAASAQQAEDQTMSQFVNHALSRLVSLSRLPHRVLVGSVLRFDREQYVEGWFSQFLRKRQLRWGRTSVHVGVLMIFAGHFVGLLTPIWVSMRWALRIPPSRCWRSWRRRRGE